MEQIQAEKITPRNRDAISSSRHIYDSLLFNTSEVHIEHTEEDVQAVSGSHWQKRYSLSGAVYVPTTKVLNLTEPSSSIVYL